MMVMHTQQQRASERERVKSGECVAHIRKGSKTETKA